ncbi:hypothetical protein RUM44_008448 [Polyplax serrata]|uniref:Uncharacterized protein n=1 Tax=Polyplax serrata TaxID=468196 RepID=A0ABR1BCC9_POLSC
MKSTQRCGEVNELVYIITPEKQRECRADPKEIRTANEKGKVCCWTNDKETEGNKSMENNPGNQKLHGGKYTHDTLREFGCVVTRQKRIFFRGEYSSRVSRTRMCAGFVIYWLINLFKRFG